MIIKKNLHVHVHVAKTMQMTIDLLIYGQQSVHLVTLHKNCTCTLSTLYAVHHSFIYSFIYQYSNPLCEDY